MKTQPNFRAYLTSCLSAGAQRSRVSEIIIRLARTTRDVLDSLTSVRSRLTFHNMMTRTSKPDVSETDVSPKKMKIQKKPHGYSRSPEVTRVCRYALTAMCRLFRSVIMGGGIAGGASLRNHVGWSSRRST